MHRNGPRGLGRVSSHDANRALGAGDVVGARRGDGSGEGQRLMMFGYCYRCLVSSFARPGRSSRLGHQWTSEEMIPDASSRRPPAIARCLLHIGTHTHPANSNQVVSALSWLIGVFDGDRRHGHPVLQTSWSRKGVESSGGVGHRRTFFCAGEAQAD
ncbi:unnamed protein product [Heligmosomoides polygyrus]|uniref:Uncharacterized protein n=1 Tax=Heligmosomoides polygyrus TaxID=6339 RepID=A0A183FPQ2_HELPZ|nr:unnamed protein product [Heligmosomoides polygyrus]